jgi:hypothetical protein
MASALWRWGHFSSKRTSRLSYRAIVDLRAVLRSAIPVQLRLQSFDLRSQPADLHVETMKVSGFRSFRFWLRLRHAAT